MQLGRNRESAPAGKSAKAILGECANRLVRSGRRPPRLSGTSVSYDRPMKPRRADLRAEPDPASPPVREIIVRVLREPKAQAALTRSLNACLGTAPASPPSIRGIGGTSTREVKPFRKFPAGAG